MAWTIDQTSGTLTHTGATLEGYAAGQHAGNARITVSCNTIADKIRVRVLSHDDLNTGWELGIDPSDTTKAQIRSVAFGTAAAASAGSTAHGISAGVPFQLEVRIEATRLTLTVRTSGVAPLVLTYEITDGLYTRFRQFGVVTDVNNAVVTAVEHCVLEPREGTRRNALCAVVGDRLYFIADRTSITEIPTKVCDSLGPCRMAELDGVVYIVGGGMAHKFDPVSITLDNWSDTTHPTNKLPGATDVGTTTATAIASHNGRIWLGVEDQLYFSAVDDPNDWKVNSLDLGAYGAGVEPAHDVIRALTPLPNNALFIGCANSSRALYGDPQFGNQNTEILSSSGGVSIGPGVVSDALRADGNTLSIFHTPEGLMVLPLAGLPVPLHRDVLRSYIQFDREDVSSYIVSMARDPKRHWLHLFVSSATSGGPSYQIAYDERAGDYVPNRGGFWPDSSPSAEDDITACIAWDGDIIMGTRDGRILVFDDSVATDDADAFEQFCHLSLMADAAPIGDTLLHSLHPILSESSAAMKFDVYGADTPERVYTSSTRTKLWPTLSVTNRSPAWAPGVARARALVVRALPATAGTIVSLERLIGMTEIGPASTPRGLYPRPTPGGPCRVPASSTGTGTGDPGVGTGPGAGTGVGTGTGTGTGIKTGTGTGSGSTSWGSGVWTGGVA